MQEKFKQYGYTFSIYMNLAFHCFEIYFNSFLMSSNSFNFPVRKVLSDPSNINRLSTLLQANSSIQKCNLQPTLTNMNCEGFKNLNVSQFPLQKYSVSSNTQFSAQFQLQNSRTKNIELQSKEPITDTRTIQIDTRLYPLFTLDQKFISEKRISLDQIIKHIFNKSSSNENQFILILYDALTITKAIPSTSYLFGLRWKDEKCFEVENKLFFRFFSKLNEYSSPSLLFANHGFSKISSNSKWTTYKYQYPNKFYQGATESILRSIL